MHCGRIFRFITGNSRVLCQSNVIMIFYYYENYVLILTSIRKCFIFSSQGIAYRNILEHTKEKVPLYAMVCSTSAKSSVRLINTTSFRDNLQFRCMKIITKYPQLLDKVQNIPGLANLCRDVWFMFPKERYQYTEKASDNQQENNNLDYPGNSVDQSTENDDINEAIFLSTYKDEPQHSSDDDPVYDDAD